MKRVTILVPDTIRFTLGSSTAARTREVPVSSKTVANALEVVDYHDRYFFAAGSVTVERIENAHNDPALSSPRRKRSPASLFLSPQPLRPDHHRLIADIKQKAGRPSSLSALRNATQSMSRSRPSFARRPVLRSADPSWFRQRIRRFGSLSMQTRRDGPHILPHELKTPGLGIPPMAKVVESAQAGRRSNKRSVTTGWYRPP